MTFAYPIWYILLCAGLGAAYALGLYFRDRKVLEGSQRQIPLFAGMRFLTVTAIALFLLSPVLNYKRSETEKPLILFALDNSSSLAQVQSKDELDALVLNWKNIQDELQGDFDVRSFHFGESMVEADGPPQFGQASTNIAAALEGFFDRYSNLNVGAVVLGSDGIYNVGTNPMYLGKQVAAPIYAVGLGDTAVRKDLRIDRSYANRIVYLDDRFTIKVDISGIHAEKEQTQLRLEKIESGNRVPLSRKKLAIDRDYFDSVQEFVVKADKAGVMHLRLSLDPVKGEVTTANNYADLFIDVLDARQKVLLIAHAPHPDITAIKQVLVKNSNYEIEYKLARDFSGAVKNYDLAILHQLPSSNYPVDQLLGELRNEGIPALFILGTKTNIGAFNNAQTVARIAGSNGTINEVQAQLNNSFNLFTLDEETRGELRRYPPLQSPFGQYESKPEARVMLTQRVGTVTTDYPLLAFSESGTQRTGVLAAEGMWRWRLYDWFEHDSHDQFEELIGKSLQYLSVKSDRRTFRTILAGNVFTENEQVIIQAELYNDSYEPVNTPDAALVITNAEGQSFDFRFNRKGNAYFLNAGSLPPGDYTYTASTQWDGKTESHSGKFTISPVQLEAVRITANHGLLNSLATTSGGSFITQQQIADLPNRIRENNEIRPVLHESVRSRSLLHVKGLFFMLLALLSLEWFMRKYSGGY